MRRSGLISLLALAIAGGGLAHAEDPGVPTKRMQPDSDMPSSLDRFVQNAIDEGLLTPSQPQGSPADEPQPAPFATSPQQSSAQAGPISLRPKQSVAETICRDRDPFDFSGYHSLRTYDDLLAWRSKAEAGHPEEFKTALARAYIALGLNEEARLQLSGVVGPEASALRRLAYMMEDRGAPDVEYFRQQASCPDVSGIWYSVALFTTDRDDAARRFDARINEFRRLPFQLRVEIATRVVPVLDAAGERLVAEKLMANFSDADISASSRLAFNKALMAQQGGAEEARNTMRNYLNIPEFRDEAAASLLRNGHQLTPDVQEDVAARVIEQIGQVEQAGAGARNLDIMLNDLHEVAGYGLTLQLASMPATQTPEAREQVISHFASLADTGLSSGDAFDNLEAMDAILAGAALLEGRPEGERLFLDASQLAVDLGLRNLAATFASRTSDPEHLAEARTVLAFRMLDHDAIKVFATRFPDNREIARLAALSAVRAGDRALLSKMESGFQADAQTIISLIEMDAVSGHWMVPDRIYKAAWSLEDEESRARVSRVSTLRSQSSSEPSAPVFAVADIATALTRIGKSLDPDAMEAH